MWSLLLLMSCPLFLHSSLGLPSVVNLKTHIAVISNCYCCSYFHNNYQYIAWMKYLNNRKTHNMTIFFTESYYKLTINLPSGGSAYIRDLNRVVTIPSDVLAYSGVRPRIGSLLTFKLFSQDSLAIMVIFFTFRWLDDKAKLGRTSNVKINEKHRKGNCKARF